MAASDTLSPFPATSYDFVDYGKALNWIGGEWRAPSGSETIEVLNPRHGKTMGSVGVSTTADIAAAVEVAAGAMRDWRQVPIKERVQVLFRAKNIMHRQMEELAWLVSHENGKAYAEAKASVEKGIECLEMGTSLQNMVGGEQLDVSRGVNCRVDYEPVGVCAGVAPFNFPIMVPLWMLPQALLAGNSFILKPSEQVPFSSNRLAQIFDEAGLPKGVLNVVHGTKEVVEAISDHPEIKAVGFVGSTKVARIVYERASKVGKRVLALGGAKNHMLVVPDADVDLTAANVVASAYGCAGQRCMAASVLLAVGDVQHIIDKIAGVAEKVKLGEDMGCIINPAAMERITGYIDKAEQMGAKVLVDGRGKNVPGAPGWWLGPTILDNVTLDMPAACDEIFGPVLSIVRVPTLDEAIAIENKNPYGNAASIYTTSGAVAKYAIERFEAGMCAVNIGVPVPREPFAFGGWNESKFGHGDLTGFDGFRFWTRPRKVTTKWELQTDTNWMS